MTSSCQSALIDQMSADTPQWGILDAIHCHIYHSEKEQDTIPAGKVFLTTNQRWMAVGSYANLINKILHLRLSWCMLLDSIKIVAML